MNSNTVTITGHATDGLGNPFPSTAAQPCPACGHCPTCGRGGHQVAPWVVPMPYYPQPYQPWWGPTWTGGGTTITCGNT